MFLKSMLSLSTSPLLGVNLQVWISIGILAIALITILTQWRKERKRKKENEEKERKEKEEKERKEKEKNTELLIKIKLKLENLVGWKETVDAHLQQLFTLHDGDNERLHALEKNMEKNKLIINNELSAINTDLSAIKEELLRRRSRKGAPISLSSPLKPATGAIDVLKNLNLLAQVDENISYIQDEIEKRSQTSTYPNIEDLEERYIEFTPGVLHGLIKRGKIDVKKIDAALNELEVSFPAVTYYGVLLLITAYILEKYLRKKLDYD